VSIAPLDMSVARGPTISPHHCAAMHCARHLRPIIVPTIIATAIFAMRPNDGVVCPNARLVDKG